MSHFGTAKDSISSRQWGKLTTWPVDAVQAHPTLQYTVLLLQNTAYHMYTESYTNLPNTPVT